MMPIRLVSWPTPDKVASSEKATKTMILQKRIVRLTYLRGHHLQRYHNRLCVLGCSPIFVFLFFPGLVCFLRVSVSPCLRGEILTYLRCDHFGAGIIGLASAALAG